MLMYGLHCCSVFNIRCIYIYHVISSVQWAPVNFQPHQAVAREGLLVEATICWRGQSPCGRWSAQRTTPQCAGDRMIDNDRHRLTVPISSDIIQYHPISWGHPKIEESTYSPAMLTVLAGGVLLFSVLVSLLSAFPETNCVVPQGRPRVQVQRVGAFSVWILFTVLFWCGGFLATVFHRPSNRWWSWLLIVETAVE